MSLWSKKSGGTANGADASVAKAVEAPRAAAPAPTTPPATTAPADKSDTVAAKPQLSKQEQQQAALQSKMMMAAYGEIISVLSKSQHYKGATLTDLEWLVVPAVVNAQFTLAEAQSKSNGFVTPVGLVMWAFVSPEVDARLTANIAAPVKLTPQEWKSGDIIWVVDAVGQPRIVDALLKQVMKTTWKGRNAKMRARTKDGQCAVATLTAAPPQNAPSPA